MPTSALFCLATSRGRADRIIHDLKSAGFAANEVALLFVERRTESDPEHDPRALPSSVAAAQSAASIRGVFGWIAGIRRFAASGLETLIAAGPVIATLHDARSSGLGVGVADGLLRLGMPAAAAERFVQQLKKTDHILISVHTSDPDKIVRARAIFAGSHAEDISPATETSAAT